MMSRVQLIIVLVIGSCGFALAQESYVYFSWDFNQPLTNTNWIGNSSARGAKLGFRKFIGQERRISAGIDINWNYLQEYKPTETFQTSSGAITTDYFNDIFQVAVAASGQYYFPLGNKEHFFPYVGLGLGANRNKYSVSYNIYKDEEEAWGFLARPEAGMLIRIGNRRRAGIIAAVHYDYSTNKSSNYEYSSFSTVGFQLGVTFFQW